MTRRLAPLCGLVPLCIALALSLGARTAPPAVFDGLLPGRLHVPLEELALRAPLAPDQGFRVAEIGRDEHTSHHVVTIREREVPHRHDRHDLIVVMLRGHGHMRLGDEERPVGEGSVLYVPRGTPHAFRNGSDAPAVAYAMYAPAFDGTDRVTVD